MFRSPHFSQKTHQFIEGLDKKYSAQLGESQYFTASRGGGIENVSTDKVVIEYFEPTNPKFKYVALFKEGHVLSKNKDGQYEIEKSYAIKQNKIYEFSAKERKRVTPLLDRKLQESFILDKTQSMTR